MKQLLQAALAPVTPTSNPGATHCPDCGEVTGYGLCPDCHSNRAEEYRELQYEKQETLRTIQRAEQSGDVAVARQERVYLKELDTRMAELQASPA